MSSNALNLLLHYMTLSLCLLAAAVYLNQEWNHIASSSTTAIAIVHEFILNIDISNTGVCIELKLLLIILNFHFHSRRISTQTANTEIRVCLFGCVFGIPNHAFGKMENCRAFVVQNTHVHILEPKRHPWCMCVYMYDG